jgi:AcrR family transcriptional regulator
MARTTIAIAEKPPRKSSSTRKPAPVGRPPGRNRDARLTTILAVARKHFAEKGFAQTTFIGIGHDAGMTHTALYSYFDSKADLYLATLIDTQAQFLPDFLRTMEECKTLRERFKRIAMTTSTAHARDSSITGFLSALPIEIRRHPELNTALLQQNNAVYQVMASMFDEAKHNGEISTNASTINLVSAFFGGTVGVALFQYGLQAPSMTDAMNVFLEMIEGNIFTAES